MMRPELSSRLLPTLVLSIATVVFILSWLGLSWVGEVVSWSLAPYDTTPPELRPPQGTWQRDLSDAFQYSVGNKMLAALLVGLNLALFLLALRRMPKSPGEWIRLMIGFALANLAVAIGVTASVSVMGSLPVEPAPYPGYGWTVKFLIPELVLLGLWIMLQARSIPRWTAVRGRRGGKLNGQH